MTCRTRTTRAASIVSLGLALQLATSLGAVAADQAIDYNRDVRPILSDYCFACHGPDKNQRKADLRLDLRDEAMRSGTIEPGKPEESELVARIFSDDPEELMPPRKSNKPLSAAQKETLKRWVAAGAPYAGHWAYTPIARPVVPKPIDESTIRNPIDAFLQATLQARKIAPAPEADRRTLIRRLSLDLLGLPPGLDEVRAFVESGDPRAYEKLVERFLASPHYGERMAVPWLDLVRYADTVGYHGDQNHNAWPYRDYVIDAFNANMPFDRFTTEQLAGDLLPNPTDSQRVATCFNRLNMVTREGGAQPKEYLAKSAADRVRTVGMTWLGSTLGCCECHDHKFDPFTSRDFYALSAFFSDVKQWGVYHDYGYTPNPELRGWSNDHPFPPEIVVESRALKDRIARSAEAIDAAVKEADARLDGHPDALAAFEKWRHILLDYLTANPSGWESSIASAGNGIPTPRARGKSAPKKASTPAPAPRVDDDGTVISAASGPTNDEFRLKISPGHLAAIRVELLPGKESASKVLRPGVNESLVRLQAALSRRGASQPETLRFRAAAADRYAPRYQNGFELLGILDGWKVDAAAARAPMTAIWLLERPLSIGEGDVLVVTLLGNAGVGTRISTSPLAPEERAKATTREPLARALESPSAALSPLVREAYLWSTAWDARAFAKVTALEARIRECRGGRSPVMVVESVRPATTRVLPRGNWQDESGPIVAPAVPRFLPQPTGRSDGGRLTRLDLARWLVAPENPLTARVFVNRLWKQFFGQGLSAQVDDLGAQGEWPGQPELLDWLAAEFRESGWNVKHLVTLIVSSHAYRHASDPPPEVHELDPNNRLLASQSPRRLDAEFIRDNALAIAGLLDLEVGGPPSFPYQPAGYYANLQFPDRNYLADAGALQYRRGVYTHWQRTFLHPMLAAFDAPSREDCIAARTAANSPQQGLTLLNDPTFVEAARAFATRILADPGAADSARVDLAYERALARSPTTDEKRSLLALLEKVRAQYKSRPEDASKLQTIGQFSAPKSIDIIELASWTQVCRVILNLHETITRY
jgi:hypothetical protein